MSYLSATDKKEVQDGCVKYNLASYDVLRDEIVIFMKILTWTDGKVLHDLTSTR